MIIITYEIETKDLFGNKIEERQFKTDDIELAVKIFKDLKASKDVRFIELKSI